MAKMTKFTAIQNALRLCEQIGFDISENLSFEVTENDTVCLENKTYSGFCAIEVGFFSYGYFYEKKDLKGGKDHVEFTDAEAEILKYIIKI